MSTSFISNQVKVKKSFQFCEKMIKWSVLHKYDNLYCLHDIVLQYPPSIFLRWKYKELSVISLDFCLFIDSNECILGKHNCHPKAACHNTIGSFKCICGTGYNGDGVNCEGRPMNYGLHTLSHANTSQIQQ